MIEELKKLRELTETLTGNGYLRDQAEEWERALNAIPDHVYIINTHFQIKFVNRSLSMRLGKTKEELYNAPCDEVVHCGEKNNSFSEEWTEVDRRKGVQVFNNLYLDNLGGWFDMTRSPIYTKTNKLIGFICVLQDITEKKKALEDLKARESTLKSIYHTAPIGIILLDAKTRIIKQANDYLCELFNYSLKEMIGHSIKMLYKSEVEYERAGKVKIEGIGKKGEVSLESKMRTKEGKILDVVIKAARMEDKGRLLILTITDVTKKKQIERESYENKEKYRLIIDNVADAIWTIDTDLNFTFINPAIKNLMGFDPEEWIGHSIAEFASEEDFAFMTEKVAEALSNPSFEGVTFNTKMLNKAGQPVPIEINAKALRNKKGNLIGFQGMTRIIEK
jgi:PAS domain S-box-containing protein